MKVEKFMHNKIPYNGNIYNGTNLYHLKWENIIKILVQNIKVNKYQLLLLKTERLKRARAFQDNFEFIKMYLNKISEYCRIWESTGFTAVIISPT